MPGLIPGSRRHISAKIHEVTTLIGIFKLFTKHIWSTGVPMNVLAKLLSIQRGDLERSLCP